MRRFEVEINGYCIIELDDEVIDAVDDNWRANFYNLRTPEEIAAHIAYNILIGGLDLTALDGWADQSRTGAIIREDDFEFEGKETK